MLIADGYGTKSPRELALRQPDRWRPLCVGPQDRIPVGRTTAFVADHTEQIYA